MMKRLCFLSPDLQHAQKVVADLRADGIAQQHIYAIARSDVPMDGLPDGGPEDDDFLPALERGVGFGGVTGLFLGLVGMSFPPLGFVVGGGAVVLAAVAGASLGGLLSGIAGAAFPSSRLAVFRDEIKAGKILILVDVPAARIGHVNELIRRFDPTVQIEGVEPHAPIIPR